jgi:hypothetical protein
MFDVKLTVRFEPTYCVCRFRDVVIHTEPWIGILPCLNMRHSDVLHPTSDVLQLLLSYHFLASTVSPPPSVEPSSTQHIAVSSSHRAIERDHRFLESQIPDQKLMVSSGPVYLHPCFHWPHEMDQGTLRTRSPIAYRCNSEHELGSIPDSDRILRYGQATACAYLDARDIVWIHIPESSKKRAGLDCCSTRVLRIESLKKRTLKLRKELLAPRSTFPARSRAKHYVKKHLTTSDGYNPHLVMCIKLVSVDRRQNW